MKTVLDLIRLSAEYLKGKGVKEHRRSAEELIADALGVNRLELYLSYDRPLVEDELEKIRMRVKRRGQGEPWQYIHGSVAFYGCNLKVSPEVLIPRQETEILVDLIVKELAGKELEGKSLLDLCSGSGCIGLSLKKRFPVLKVTLADQSLDALNVASENAERNKLQVDIAHGDFLHPLREAKFDLIVSNPPYISSKCYENLDREVKDFEPKVALVAGDSGLEFYERFASEGFKFLAPEGKAWFEIGFDQGKAVLDIFKGHPWKNLKVQQDWAGHDRFFSLEIE